MTELQWLIKVLTQQKLSNTLKDLFIERIGEVESRLGGRAIHSPTPIVVSPTSQAPSTQKILDEIAMERNAQPIMPQKVIVPRRTQTKDVVVTSTTAGGFTQGPKKW